MICVIPTSPTACGSGRQGGGGGPGRPGGDRYVIGDPTLPPIHFDDDFVYDPEASAGLGDYRSWNEWGFTSDGARIVRPDLDDALDLHDHYRDASGDKVTVDYEEGYREDPKIRSTVDNEIASAREWAEKIHNETGRTSFSINGDAGQGAYPETENWQKARGGYTTWGSGNVRIEGNTATMEITVHAEDRYNFNRGEEDIATGTPDEENGRFAELGWAKSFDVSGTVTRTVTWELGSSAPPVVSDGDVDRDPAGEDRVDGAGSSR